MTVTAAAAAATTTFVFQNAKISHLITCFAASFIFIHCWFLCFCLYNYVCLWVLSVYSVMCVCVVIIGLVPEINFD